MMKLFQKFTVSVIIAITSFATNAGQSVLEPENLDIARQKTDTPDWPFEVNKETGKCELQPKGTKMGLTLGECEWNRQHWKPAEAE